MYALVRHLKHRIRAGDGDISARPGICVVKRTVNKKTMKKAKVAAKKQPRSAVKGYGDMTVSQLAKSLGGAALRKGGNYVGGLLAGPMGASLGDWISGHGDYAVSTNSLLGGHQIPVFREGKRSIVVKHREYLTDIQSSTGFNLQSYALNPGLAATFPWLSSVAENFEQCRWHGLVFEFRSTSGSAIASTNNALGAVIQSTEYNVNKPSFTSKQQMEAYEFSCSAKPSESFIHPIECAPAETQTGIFNVRSGPVAGQELRMYDLGNYQIATLGMQAGGITIGELWVSYEVEFLKPVLPLSLYSGFSARLNGGAYNSTNYFGTIVPSFTGSFVPSISATGAGWDTITFPSSVMTGTFTLLMAWHGNATAVVMPTITLTNASKLTKFQLGTADTTHDSGATTVNLIVATSFQAINPAGVTPVKIVLSGGTLPASGTSIDVWIAQVSDSF